MVGARGAFTRRIGDRDGRGSRVPNWNVRKHEGRIGSADPIRPYWYADYMVAEQAGERLPS